MRYAAIYSFDISNGPGIRVSLFVQGCNKHCPGCFNPETWDFNGGVEFTNDTILELIKLSEPEWISGLSILGGEPLHPDNIQWVIKLCVRFKEKYPNKSIWIWTGYTWDELCKRCLHKTISEKDAFDVRNLLFDDVITERIGVCDCIIDGPFIESEKDLSLKWRGSKNQHIWRRGGKKMSDNHNKWYCEE